MKNATQRHNVATPRLSLKRSATVALPPSESSDTTCMSPWTPISGRSLRSSRFASACPCGTTAAKRRDSGSARQSATASSNGSTPPTTNTARQPNGEISWAAAMPAAIAPSDMPLPTNITIIARRGRGAYSDASPIAFGSALPKPSPVRKRTTSKELRESTGRVNSVPTPNATHEKMITRRRPTRSASGASSMAPSMTPNRPALNVGPSAPRASPHSWLIAGAA